MGLRRFKNLGELLGLGLKPHGTDGDPNGTDSESAVDPDWMGVPRSIVRLDQHPFAPGTEVGVHPAHTVGVERGLGREPMETPEQVFTVPEDGELEVSGLEPGRYCAAGRVGDRYHYVQFSVA